MTDPQFTFQILVILIVTLVTATLYFDTDAFIRYISHTSGRQEFRTTRIQRTASTVYSFLFILSLIVAMVFYLMSPDNLWIFTGLTALIIGFGVQSLLYQICFINPYGLGVINRKMEIEIPWDFISDYRWEKNTLHLVLRKRRVLQPVFHFSDPSAILIVNAYLASRSRAGHLPAEDTLYAENSL